MEEKLINQAYEIAKERYANIGIDTDKVLEAMQNFHLSLHCWQADDVTGFEKLATSLSGGIQVTGNYPGKARNIDELRQDIIKAKSLIPGTHRLNLHEIYGDFKGQAVDRDEVTPEHFRSWMDWGKENNMKRKIRGLFFSIGIAGSLILGGCGKEEKEPVTITMIHAWGGTGEDHVAMRDIYDGFQKENPDIEVQLISMPGRKEMLRKVEDMIMVGDMPDVITFSGMGQNTTYDFIVENDMALDIMPYVKKDEEFASNISQTNLNYWTTEEGELFTVSDVLSLSGGYWYNEDILHAAGVREIPRTWDAFRGMCYKIWKWSERENNEIASLQTSPEGYLYFMDHMLLEEGTEKDRNDVGTISEVLKRLQEIYVYSTSENAEYSYLDETRLFNEGKLAIYVNGVWGASMISENINAKYALLPTTSGKKLSCESACFGYVLGKSGNEQKEEASIRFLKYMLSKKVQTRILEETEQIPANKQVVLDSYEKEMPRLFQAASLVLSAEDKIEVPDNLWTYEQKAYFTENIFRELTGKISPEAFTRQLGEMKIDK